MNTSNQVSLAAQFVQSVEGMTNEEIIEFLEDKSASYEDNLLTDHSGHEFEPVKFTFTDGSLVFIHDWAEETPRFVVDDTPDSSPAKPSQAEIAAAMAEYRASLQ